MSVLNIEALRDLASNHKLFDNFDNNNFQPSSYDLRIGTIYQDKVIWSYDNPIENKHYIEVHPSEIITMLTQERIKMPHDCCGTVFSLNSKSSSGFLILNPGHIDPGFEGPISICAINMSTEIKRLRLSDKIFTLIINKLDNEVVEIKDQYQNKKNKVRRDEEISQYRNRFSKLSKGFFELAINDDILPNQLAIKIFDVLKKKYTKWIIGIVTSIVTIIGIIQMLPSESTQIQPIIFNLPETENIIYLNKEISKQNTQYKEIIKKVNSLENRILLQEKQQLKGVSKKTN
jgi:deoxycytidine triphosphate deaminase